MRTLIRHGMIVTGDGRMLNRGTLVLEDDCILEVTSANIGSCSDVETMDAMGQIVMPGIINNHAHGVVLGAPLFGTGATPLTDRVTLNNLDKHLLEGTTTLLNVDGFATMARAEMTAAKHPINIKTSTIHTPLNIKAAHLCDGDGIRIEHEEQTVEGMLQQVAVAIAEVGDGGTLGGGSQDYMYIPRAIEKATGIKISSEQACALKLAVLGKYILPPTYNPGDVTLLLQELNLQDKIDESGVKALIESTVLPPFRVAIDGMLEGGEYAQRYKAPIIVHHAAASLQVVKKMAYLGPLLIAGHSNHPSFELQECIDAARYLKEHGVVIDISTVDTFGAQRMVKSPDNFYSLVKQGIADTISTDYGGGNYDAITLSLQHLVTDGICSLPKAVAMATGNVASAFPQLAPERGVLKKGNVADIIFVDKADISKVNTVMVGGKVVVDDGRLVYRG